MSESSHAPAAAHGHHDKPDHHPHVLPLPYYFGVWAALLVFTVLTVGVSYLDFGGANLAIAVVIATIKAAMVATIFMHLRWDSKFNAVTFASSLVFLAIFVGFTMADTEGRGMAEPIEAEHPVDMKQPWGMKRSEKERIDARERAMKKAAAPADQAPAPAH